MRPFTDTERGDRDEGFVLISIIGILAVLTIVAIAAFTLSTNNLRLTQHEEKAAQALHVAEAGLDETIYRIDKTPSVIAPLPYHYIVSTPSGDASVTVTAPEGQGYLVVSTCTTGSPAVTRRVSGTLYRMALWDMFYADGPFEAVGSTGKLNGNGNLYGSFYCRGDWPWSNGNADFNTGPFYIKDGNVQLSGAAGFAKDGVPVAVYCDGNVTAPSFPGTWYPTCPDIRLPPLNLSNNYALALAESVDGYQSNPNISPASWTVNGETSSGMVQAGSPGGYSGGGMDYYKVIDNDSNPKNLSKGTVTLSGDFGAAGDDFAIIGGVLYVYGTVYVDAATLNVNVSKFAGKGTIACSGNINVNQDDPSRAFVPNVMGNYPAVDNVALCAYGSIMDYEYLGYGPRYSATSWGQNPAGNYDNFYGATLAPTIGIGKHGSLHVTPNTSTYLPPGLPGGESTIVSFAWRDGPK